MLPVSVIIPTFNRKDMLKRAIDSVIRQSLACSELIVVDDGSNDGTEQMIESLNVAPKLIYAKIENQGPAAARNRGVELSSSPLVAFLDSDDHWHKRKLEKQVSFLTENSDFKICHTYEKWFRRGVHLNQKKIHIPRHGDIFSHCLQLCGVGMSTVLMYRDFFNHHGGFDETLRCCEDYDFWLRISCQEKFLLLKEPLTIKEGGREDQLSWLFRVGMDKFRIYSIEKLLQSMTLNDEQRILAIQEFIKKCEVYGNGCLKHGKIDEAEKYLERAKSKFT